MATSPNERGVLGLCTRLRDTAFKRTLAELPVGAEVEVEQPKGDFVLPAETDPPYVFVAGGIGITVFRSMLRYIAEEELRTASRWSTRTATASRPRSWKSCRSSSARTRTALVLTMTDDPDWDGERRRIGPDLLRDASRGRLGPFRYLIAGPPGMVEGVTEQLRDAGIPDERIRPDRFSGY